MTTVFSTFSEAADHFISVAYWLTDAEAPMVTSLAQAAASLDQGVRATMLGEFRQAYTYLRNLAPTEEKVVDELDSLLATL